MNHDDHMAYTLETKLKFAKALKFYRMILDMTQEEFNANIPIGTSTYTTFEGGSSIPSDNTVKKIEIAIGYTVDEIIDWYEQCKVFARPPMGKQEAS